MTDSAFPDDQGSKNLGVSLDLTLRKPSHLCDVIGDNNAPIVTSELLRSQLEFLLGPDCYWGDAKTISDCFNERIVDDGIVSFKILESKNPTQQQRRFYYYWVAYFGGNPTGYLLVPNQTAVDAQDLTSRPWKVLIENCDTDFIWRGGDDNVDHGRQQLFIKNVKKVVMGKYYDEEEEEE